MKRHILNACFFLNLLCSCSFQEKKEQNLTNITLFEDEVMTMRYKVIIGSNLSSAEKLKVQTLIDQTFDEINFIYNKWNPSSEISSLNSLKKENKVQLSLKLQSFLEQTEKLVFLTEEKFDPTIEPLQKLWKKALIQGNIPTKELRNQIANSIGWKHITLQNGMFSKDHDDVSLDLGGIAKGFAVDLIAFKLNEAGFSDLFVEWGGEIKATGKHPDNRLWRVFISNLYDTNPDHAIATFDLENMSIATSGDYLQNWTVKQNNKLKTYFHIFDKTKLKPLTIKRSSIASASVIANSCFVADVLATTLMLFPNKNEALEWFEKMKDHYPEIQCLIVTRDDLKK